MGSHLCAHADPGRRSMNRSRRVRVGVAVALLAGAVAVFTVQPARAQQRSTGTAATQPSAGAALAVLPMEISWEAANQVDDTDHAIADAAEAQLRKALTRDGHYRLIEAERVYPAAEAAREGLPTCTDGCPKATGEQVGADRVLASRLSKFSGLIWFLDGRLIDARTGEVIHSEHLELKGSPSDMVPGGVASLARRMGKH